MNIRKTYALPLMAAAALAAGCSDLDLMPEGNIITEDTKKEVGEIMPDRAAADLTGLYNKMASPCPVLGLSADYPDDGGYSITCVLFDMNAADITGPDAGYNWLSTSSEWADRNPNYRNPALRWRLFYQQIKLANDIIRGISRDTESDDLRYTLGQALAVRAFDYLNLAPYYQFNYATSADKLCVPYIDETSEGNAFARNTVREVYDHILADLTDAIALLDGYKRSTKANVDVCVAYGLRARAYLAMEKWAEAAADATAALEAAQTSPGCDGQPYSMAEVSRPTFCTLEDHNWMWGIKMTDAMVAGSYSSWPSWLGSFSKNAYSTAVGLYAVINTMLYDKIPDTDIRKQWWVDENLHSDNLANITWDGLTGDDIALANVADVKMPYLPYTNVKFGFQEGSDLTKNGGDWAIMRVEEMILIQAEAYAKAGDEAKGRQILTDFVTNYRNPAYTQVCRTFADEVWMQRRVELWGEGFAMSDVMRLGKNMVRFNESHGSNYPANFQFNVEYGDPYMLLRIPQSEVTSNKDIIQNTGGVQPKAGNGAGLTDGVTD